MKKSDIYENGAAKSAKVNLIIAVGLGLLVAVVIGFNLGAPSAKEREKAETVQKEYQNLLRVVRQADEAVKDNWDCRQGPVDVTIETGKRVVNASGYIMYSNGRMVEEYGTTPTIKTVSEHTTMDCHRQVKQYVDKAE